EVYLKIFGPEHFFIELQSHIPEQAAVNPELVDLADSLGVGLVATNDVHFLLPEDHAPHNALCCIATGKRISDESRLIYPTQLYLKSASEMRAAAPDLSRWSEACDRTVDIAARCNVELDLKANHAPVVKLEIDESLTGLEGAGAAEKAAHFRCEHPVGSTEWFTEYCGHVQLQPFDEHKDHESSSELKDRCDEALRDLVEAGAIWRYGVAGIDESIRRRLDRELQVLSEKGISAYFLIVWDFVNHARRKHIPCNARGSGVGTMVGYCLGLSNACPVKYGLLFERFTDPDRSEYPDIDIDICQDGRAEIIDYVRKKYGHVAQIITFGTLKARAVIRDVGRVMDVPLSDVDRIAKLVPSELQMTLDRALEVEPDLRKEYDQDAQTRQLIDIGRRLEGLTRHASVHAAGVVLATQPLENIIPLYRDPKSGDVMTQWDGPTVEEVGLLKMDFLGLRTLSTIEKARKLILATLEPETQRQTVLGGFGAGPCPDTPREFGAAADSQEPFDPLDFERLTFLDQNVLDLFRRGETAGVFQFESGGMRSLLMGMQPDRLEDLIAANALFRPGPMELIPQYNDRKHGRAPVPSIHPIVDRFTEETYGVMVYQEQVMQIIHELGEVPLREAYSIIKAISKKKHKVIDSARDQFIRGAGAKDLPPARAQELFELVLKFAGYGFNKSHSTGYAIVAYQTAYLKTYFPVQYMAAVLTYESGSIEKVKEYIEACKTVRFPDGHVGIDVRPPQINLSRSAFTVVFEDEEAHDPNHGHIRFGLGAVKGVGEKAVAAIIEARKKGGPFTSLYDFCERVSQKLVNKAVIEALIKCGAFDDLHGHGKRSAMIAGVEDAMKRGAQDAELREKGSLFGDMVQDAQAAGAEAIDEPPLPDVSPWETSHMLREEKDVLGFYVSSHPMARWESVLRRFSSVQVTEARQLRADTEIVLGGMLTRARVTMVKKGRSAGQKMAMLGIEDASGVMEGVIFSDGYARYAHLLHEDRILFLKGRIDRRREEPSIMVDQVVPVEEAEDELTACVRIVIRDHHADGQERRPNGELKSLRTMLRQSSGQVPVRLDVEVDGQV
ncbi:MAG: DNA polymerase III subunit alpha, partial [Phycisphaerae bacterium]|nr:DNA polymerase III subunit alpha [Phycisphaerae bacterium]